MSTAVNASAIAAGRRRRPVVVTIAAVAHLVMGACCLALVIYLLYLTRSPEILGKPNAAERVQAFRLGALVLGAVALPFVAGAIGMWKGRFWGWLIAVVADAAVAALLLWSSLTPNTFDWDDASLVLVFVVLLALVWLPGVRRWCGRRSGSRPRAASVAG